MNHVDEDRSVYNGHFELDILIDCPVGQVWKQYLDTPSWVVSHQIERVCGSPDAVGYITRVSDIASKDQGYPPPWHHYCKIIKLLPEHQYVLKTYSEKGGSYGMVMTCFDDTRLIAVDAKTHVIFNLYAEIRGDIVAKDPAAMNLDASVEGMGKNLNNLKRMMESG